MVRTELRFGVHNGQSCPNTEITMKIVFTTLILEEAIAYCDKRKLQDLIIDRTICGRYNVLRA